MEPITLAIADDHLTYRNGFMSTLRLSYPNDFRFMFDCADGKELIERLSSLEKLPDIVLLDVSMPIMNGYVAMEIIHKRWPDLKVLGMSMYNEDYVVIKMLLNGASGFITKGMSPQDTYTALTTVNRKGKYFFGLSAKFATQSVSSLKEFIPNITEKEMKFLALCTAEMTYEEMASELGISKRTVHGYRDILFNKFDISSRVGLAMFAIRIGLKPNLDICQGSIESTTKFL